MKRNLVLTVMALIMAIMGVRTTFAQGSIDAVAVPKLVPIITNQGAVGGINASGLLSASSPTALNGFNARDVAVSAGQIYAVGTSGGVPTLIRLGATSAAGAALGEGTFALPQVVTLDNQPRAVFVADVDLDGRDDVIIAEGTAALQDGQIEVFTGRFLQTGVVTRFDFSTLADLALDGVIDGDTAPILTSLGAVPISVTVDRIDGDAFGDIAYLATDGALTGSVEVLFSTTTGPGFALPVTAVAGVPISTNGPAPAGIDADVLNVVAVGSGATTPDATPDIVFAAAAGAVIIPTIPEIVDPLNIDPTFDAPVTLVEGTRPIGVIAADVTRDNLVDIITLNAGSGNLSTSVASAGGGYGAPVRSVPIGVNPIDIAAINFNNDGIPDVVVANAPPPGGAINGGTITVLTGNGSGGFVTARTLRGVGPTSVGAGSLRVGSQGEDVVFGGISVLGGLGAQGVHFLSNGATAFGVVRVKIFSAVSLAASIDRTGAGNDVVVIEQNNGLVFILLNISGGAALPTVAAIDLNDLFTTQITSPTSATPFRDAQTNLTNLAITDVTNPTNNTGFGQLVVLLNDGSGTFTDFGAFRQFVATDGATNILSSDFNNDGSDDLVYIDVKVNAAFVALNDGGNFFLRIQFQETGAFVPVAARLGDINDDDRIDLVVAHQGSLFVQANQSTVTTLLGDGSGRLQPSGPLLDVPNFALSLIGGVANFETNNIPRIVDFNLDGFPDFAVATTRGGVSNVAGVVPSVTILLNRPDSPGNFNVQLPIALIDDTPINLSANLQLEGIFGGPGLVSGRFGDPTTQDAGIGVGFGGANYVMSVADFNADGSPDLCVSGATLLAFDLDGNGLGDAGTSVAGLPGVPLSQNFRASIFLIGNETAGSVRVSRPLRAAEYTLDFALGVNASLNPFTEGGDTFVANATGNFLALNNFVPDIFHISLNGNIWVDVNTSSILNHAPVVNIARADLNAPLGQGRKVIITSGQTATVRVTAADVDSDTLRFSLVPTPTGQQPPSFISINPTTGQITINSADVNRGPGVATFRIAVQASDAGTVGSGGRLPLTGRDFFTLIVNPNAPPTIAPLAPLTIAAGTTQTVTLNIVDPDPNSVITNTVRCDRGTFVTLSGNTLSISPQAGDVGTTTCTITSSDQFGLSVTSQFTITVTSQNVAPTIGNIADVTVRAGDAPRTITVTATDTAGDRLTLSLTSAPAFVSLSDNGNGTGTLRIAPSLTDTTGGRVTVQVRDAAGLTASTSFNVNVQAAVQIAAASRAKPNLFISGTGFGASGATVTINGLNATSRVIGQNNNSITLKGSNRKLGLRAGPNQIQVTSGGVQSNTFVLNLLSAED